MATDPTADRDSWFTRFRADWFRMMRPIGSWVPWELREHVQLDDREQERPFWGEGLMQPAVGLRQEHLGRCRVLPDRLTLIEQLPKGGVVAELGTLHGEFAREILRTVDPTELHLVDHELQPRARELATDPTFNGRVHVHAGDSVQTLETFADGYFDWIYIDAQHTYEGVRRDIAAAVRKVKADGLLVFNDYTPWSYVEMQPYGVVAAVNELCVEQAWEIVYLALPPHLYCDVAVRKMRR